MATKTKAKMLRLVTWNVPKTGELPDGVLLVEVDKKDGDADIKLVYIDEDEQTLIEPECDDVWTSWTWGDVSRYALLDDILVKER